MPMWNPTAIWPFQSTHPVWGATRDGQLIPKVVIHFNPRTPCGVRRVSTSIRFPSWSYFNPRTPCGVRHAWPATGQTRYSISIHAPRVGCDDGWAMCPQCGKDFNPRTPCGVRHRRTGLGRGDCHFNPRTPCGVRLYSGWIIKRGFKISIHAPRVGCDWKMWKVIKRQCYFNPRTPCGVRPQASLTASIFSNFNPRTPCGVRHSAPSGPLYRRCISIHAPRVGCDQYHHRGRERGPDFNPRTPCGVRRVERACTVTVLGFQSTHPVWGATNWPLITKEDHMISIHAPRVGCDGDNPFCLTACSISIHAPRVGCDCRYRGQRLRRRDFNPRTPCGVRPCGTGGDYDRKNFNPRTPCGVRRHQCATWSRGFPFQSTHPVWGATLTASACSVRSLRFQSTHPVWGATRCFFGKNFR